MRTCIICHKAVHRHCRFVAQNTVVKGKTHWEFAHAHCFEQQVLQPGRNMLALIQSLGNKIRRT